MQVLLLALLPPAPFFFLPSVSPSLFPSSLLHSLSPSLPLSFPPKTESLLYLLPPSLDRVSSSYSGTLYVDQTGLVPQALELKAYITTWLHHANDFLVIWEVLVGLLYHLPA